ncbi:MAG: DrmE family protein, partial [bacterium]
MNIINILKIINNKMDYLDRIKVSLKNQELNINYYDIINMYYVNLTMTDEKSNYDIIIHPTRELTLIYYIIAAALTAYETDLSDVSSDLINNLKIGDKVKVSGCLGEFLGKEEILGEVKLKIKFSDMDYYIPIKNIWKINKYEGSATRLNKYCDRRDSTKQRGRNVLADIFDIDKKKHNIVHKTKVIIVTQKKFATNIFRQLEINNMPFTRIFSTGYYTTEEKIERIGKDHLQRNPVICFTSDLSVAHNIIDENTVLMIFDATSYTNIPTVQMERILTDYQELNMITLMNNNENLFIFDKIGMNLYNWDKETLKDLYPLDRSLKDKSIKNEIINHQSYLYNFTYHKYKIFKIKTEESFRSIRAKILEAIDKVKGNSFGTPYTLDYISKVYYILLYTQIIVHTVSFHNRLKECESLYDTINELKNIILDTLTGMYEKNEENLILLNKIPLLLEEYISYLLNKNKKGEKLLNILNNLQGNTGILVRRNKDKQIIQEWLEINGHKHIDVLTYTEVKRDKVYVNLIITGWFRELKGYPLRNELAENHIFIIYDFEEKYLGYINKKENSYSRVPSILDKFRVAERKINKEYKKEISASKADGDDISEILSDLSLNYASIDYKSDTFSKNDKDDVILEEAYFINFVEDYYSFLTDGSRVYVLSRKDEKVVTKSIKELEVGNELVFSTQNQEDIFEELISKIEKENPEIKKIKATADLWQDALNDYIAKQDDISNFIEELNKYGYHRVEATIENWLNNYDQIAPGDYGIIDAIANITGNEKLEQNIDEVIRSCKRLRVLHVQLGRYIAKMIIHSVFTK